MVPFFQITSHLPLFFSSSSKQYDTQQMKQMSRFFVTQNLPKRKGKMSVLIYCGNILTQHNLMPLLPSCLAHDPHLATPPLLPPGLSFKLLALHFLIRGFVAQAPVTEIGSYLLMLYVTCLQKNLRDNLSQPDRLNVGTFRAASSTFYGDLMVIKHIDNCELQYILRKLSIVTKSHPFN